MKRWVVMLLALLMFLPPVPAEANPLLWAFRVFFGSSVRRAAVGGVARGMLRTGSGVTGLRRLVAGSGRTLIRREVDDALRIAARRRVVVHRGRERLMQLAGRQTSYVYRAEAGHLKTAAVEGDVLVFRQGAARLGFAQWEKDGLVLYRSNGQRIARLADESERVLVYDDAGEYIGQFINELIEDQIVQIFVDKLGRRLEKLTLPASSVPPQPVTARHVAYQADGSEAGYSEIRDGILFVFAPDGAEMARGVLEDDQLIIYDTEGEKLGSFVRHGGAISALDVTGQPVGHLVPEGERVLYYENGAGEPQAWVTIGQIETESETEN